MVSFYSKLETQNQDIRRLRHYEIIVWITDSLLESSRTTPFGRFPCQMLQNDAENSISLLQPGIK